MLVEWFVDFVFRALVVIVTEVIPWPETLGLGAFGPAFGVMGAFNAVFPVTESMAAAGIVLGVQGVMLLYRVVKIILSHVPLVGGTA